MAKTASGTIIGQDWYTTSNSVSFEDGIGYVGQNDTTYYICCLKFKTPKFSGKSEKISLGLSMQMLANSSVNLRYALCTSAENCASYCWTTGEVTDDTQIAAGYQAFTLTDEYAISTIEIETDALEGETEYYLYLWGYQNYTASYINAPANHTVTLTYKTSGGVRIRTSAATNVLHVAIVRVDSSTWKRYVPMVYTANGWKRQG